jgi:cytochrome c2
MIRRISVVGVLAAGLGLAASLSAVQAEGELEEGRILVQERCTVCHNLKRVRDHIVKNDAEAWDRYVARMQKKGAKVSDAQREVIVAYLASLESEEDL